MIETIAIVTDTHFGARNNCEHFNSYFASFFKNLFFPTLKKHNIKKVIHLGDLGEYRKYINTKTLNSLRENLLEPLQDYECYFVVGNHDCYYRNTNTINLQQSLKLAEHYGYTVIADEMFTLDHTIDLIPWVSDNREKIISQIENSTSPYLFGHLEFASEVTPYNSTQLSIELLKKYQMVLSGHFHTRCSPSKNIFYIGNPYPIVWSDYMAERGFVLFKDAIEYVDNKESIFLKIYFTSRLLETYDYSLCNNKHIIIVTNNLTDNKDLFKFLSIVEKQNTLSVVIQPEEEKFIEVDLSSKDFASKDTFFYIEKYLSSLGKTTALEPKKVLNYFQHIFHTAQQVDTL